MIGYRTLSFYRYPSPPYCVEGGEFREYVKLAGLWQFIPVCRAPCISIFRNFTRDRLEYIKQSEPERRVKFMKASHVPLFWKDAPVPPFRFNPKLDKEQQGKPIFVVLKAKFLPARNMFGFEALLAPPVEKPPKFFKARKDDKAAVMAQKKKEKGAVGEPKKGKPKKKIETSKSNESAENSNTQELKAE
jgi:hypothetical protein